MSRSISEEGSVTIWLLGLCVALFFLGGVALDLRRAFSERRALAGIVDAAATAGASGIDLAEYRRSGDLRLDPELAEGLAGESLTAQGDAGSLEGAQVIATPADVTVAVTGSVDFSLLKILLPSQEPLVIEVSGTVAPREGGVE